MGEKYEAVIYEAITEENEGNEVEKRRDREAVVQGLLIIIVPISTEGY